MNQKQKNHVIKYFNKWLKCSQKKNFDELFFNNFKNVEKESYQAEILATHIHLTYNFIYKEFVNKPEYDELLNDFVKISQHCLDYAFKGFMPIGMFAKFQVSQYLKLFKEVCDMPELLDKNIYKYWIFTSQDEYNFRINAYDLLKTPQKFEVRNKWSIF